MKTLYFLNKGDLLQEGQFVPIQPKRSEWELLKNPTRLTRLYEFENYDQLRFFVSSIMSYASKIQHHPTISIIEDGQVQVETYTSTLNDITEQDIRLTKISDQIYLDATYTPQEQDDNVDDEEIENVSNDERLTEGYRFDWTIDW